MNLHLGCWKRVLPGFVNVDICDFPHIDYKNNVDDLSMFQDSTVDLIYSSHVFEYFDRTKAAEVLREWNRVLRPGGTLRIAVPDFDKLIKVYQITGELSRVLGPMFGQMEVPTKNGPEYLYHKTIYNFDSLQTMLKDAGFEDVRRYDWRDTLHKDYDDHSQAYYPHMDKENGILISLNVEATKK